MLNHMGISQFFRFREKSSTIRTEILAGITTFSSMAYIIAINPLILSQGGLNEGSVMVATILATVIGTCIMAFLANLPMAIAPGMGVSTFMVFSLILGGIMTAPQALGAVFTSGVLLLILNIFGLRAKILAALPHSVLKGAIAGIGLFLIAVGLKEIGMIETQTGSVIHLTVPQFLPSVITLVGLWSIIFFLKKNYKSAFLIGLGVVWILALVTRQTAFTEIFSRPPSMGKTFFLLSFEGFFTSNYLIGLFSIFLVTLFDSTASLITLRHLLGRDAGGMNVQRALYPDATGTILGALFGTGSLAIHLESASGIQVGGRTGFTSMIVSIGFILCLFLYPVISSLPPYASSPILAVIGTLMLVQLAGIDFKDWTEWLPALLVVLVMPIYFSIYYGFVVGFIAYTALKLLTGRYRQISWTTAIITLLLIIQVAL